MVGGLLSNYSGLCSKFHAAIDLVKHTLGYAWPPLSSASLPVCGFPCSVCTSVNDVVLHGIPRGDEVLHDGDIVNVDVTVIKDGCHGDTSRMFHIREGRPSEATPFTSAVELSNVARQALFVGLGKVRPNA